MGNKKKTGDNSRRWFLSFFLQGNNNTPSPNEVQGNSEKVKMLTADGKLVQVDKNILEKAMRNKKASNKEILNWMKNPSKEES